MPRDREVTLPSGEVERPNVLAVRRAGLRPLHPQVLRDCHVAELRGEVERLPAAVAMVA